MLLEDMALQNTASELFLNQVLIAPLMIDEADGVPCTVIAF